MAKTLQQIKDEVANDNGWSNWDSANPPWVEAREVERLMNEVVIRYAQEQNKELLKMMEQCEQWIGNCNQYAPILKVIDKLLKQAT